MNTCTDAELARQWREHRGLTREALADLTGYTSRAIYWFERGETPPNRNAKSGNGADRAIKPWVWQRYRMACAGATAQLDTRTEFNWEAGQ